MNCPYPASDTTWRSDTGHDERALPNEYSDGRACHVRIPALDRPLLFGGRDERALPCSTDAGEGVPPIVELEGPVPPRPCHR